MRLHCFCFVMMLLFAMQISWVSSSVVSRMLYFNNLARNVAIWKKVWERAKNSLKHTQTHTQKVVSTTKLTLTFFLSSRYSSSSVVSSINGNGETTYDYVFGGPLPHRTAVSHSTLKLTSPPVRLRSDSRTLCKLLSLNHVQLLLTITALIIFSNPFFLFFFLIIPQTLLLRYKI